MALDKQDFVIFLSTIEKFVKEKINTKRRRGS